MLDFFSFSLLFITLFCNFFFSYININYINFAFSYCYVFITWKSLNNWINIFYIRFLILSESFFFCRHDTQNWRERIHDIYFSMFFNVLSAKKENAIHVTEKYFFFHSHFLCFSSSYFLSLAVGRERTREREKFSFHHFL